jgi:transcription antitermination factor NusG
MLNERRVCVQSLKQNASERNFGGTAPERHWLAVYTQPRHEKTVRDHLESKAIEVFLPIATERSQWKDRRVTLEVPAFPGYVFVRTSLHERASVFSTPGVVRILSFNGRPASIDAAEIEALRLCHRNGALLEPHPFAAVGERVRVLAGMLEGLEGVVIRKKSGLRLVLSVSLINQSVAVEIDASLLEPVQATAARRGNHELRVLVQSSNARLVAVPS